MAEELLENKKEPWYLWFFKSFIWLGILMLVIDIVTKNVVVANKEAIRAASDQGIVLIPGFLAISYVINTGAAFGLSAGDSEAGFIVNRVIYIVIALIASGALIGFFVKKELDVKKGKVRPLSKYYKACIMLILAGAIGNLIDRIAYTPEYLALPGQANPHNGVVDWINFFGIWAYNFNIADSCLVIGVIMVVVMLIIEEVQDSRRRNAIIKKNMAAQKAKEAEESASKDEADRPVMAAKQVEKQPEDTSK